MEKEKLAVTDENLFIVAACGDKGISYLKGEMKANVRKISKQDSQKATGLGGRESGKLSVQINGEVFVVSLEESKATVNDQTYDVSIKEIGQADSIKSVQNEVEGEPVTAPMPGIVLDILKEPGATVDEGETVMVLEAMKMEMEIPAPQSGVVETISVDKNDQVAAGQVLGFIR